MDIGLWVSGSTGVIHFQCCSELFLACNKILLPGVHGVSHSAFDIAYVGYTIHLWFMWL